MAMKCAAAAVEVVDTAAETTARSMKAWMPPDLGTDVVAAAGEDIGSAEVAVDGVGTLLASMAAVADGIAPPGILHPNCHDLHVHHDDHHRLLAVLRIVVGLEHYAVQCRRAVAGLKNVAAAGVLEVPSVATDETAVETAAQGRIGVAAAPASGTGGGNCLARYHRRCGKQPGQMDRGSERNGNPHQDYTAV